MRAFCLDTKYENFISNYLEYPQTHRAFFSFVPIWDNYQIVQNISDLLKYFSFLIFDLLQSIEKGLPDSYMVPKV